MGLGRSGWMIIGFFVGAAIVIGTGGAALPAILQGAAIGGMIGGIAGGIIDPMDLPEAVEREGQRLEEIQIMGVQEGTGVIKAYGNQIRISGQLIGCSDVRETRHVTDKPDGGGGKKSFLVGTPITMHDGSDKAIEDIIIGDVVRTAKFSKTQKGKLRYRYRKVTHTHTGETKKVLKVFGDNFSFSCTPEHSVYGLKPNREAEWFTAESLRPGDSLLSEKGWVVVVGCDRFELEAKTYNLTVADDSNYFASGILVHNFGGGGGGDGVGIEEVIYYTYSTDVMVGICEGPLVTVDRIWMNGKDKYHNVSIFSTGANFTLKWWTIHLGGKRWDASHRFELKISGGNFDGFQAGMVVKFTGGSSVWTGQRVILAASATYIIVNMGGETIYHPKTEDQGPGDTSCPGTGGSSSCYSYSPNGFGAPTVIGGGTRAYQGQGNAVNINNAGSDPVAVATASAHAFDPGLMDDIQVYIGDDSDPNGTYGLGAQGTSYHNSNNSVSSNGVVQAINGASPNYNGIAFCVFDNMQLRDFGNQIPQMQFEINALPREPEVRGGQTGSWATLGSVLDSILIRQGYLKQKGIGYNYTSGDTINTDEFQLFSNEAYRVRGFTSIGNKTARGILSTLVTRYDLLSFERNGVLFFTSRNTTPDKEIDGSHLGAITGDGHTPLFHQTDKDSSDLPNEVNIDYYDVNDKYQRGSQKSTRAVTGLPRTTKIDIPMGLKSNEAQEIANRVLQQSHKHRKRCTFTLPPKYVDVEENDLLKISVKGEEYLIRVLELNIGADFIHEVSGLIEGVESVPYDGHDEPPDVVEEEYFPPPMHILLIDTSPMHPGGVNSLGHYIAACTIDEDQEYRGAKLWVSSESDGIYSLTAQLPFEGMIFETVSAIPDGPKGVWDEAGVITIKLLGPESSNAPPSSSILDTLNSQSALFSGGELIGFRTVTSTATEREYELTNLTRGLKGTQQHMSSHEDIEVGIVLSYNDSVAITYSDAAAEDLHTNKYYKVVPQGATISDMTPVSASLQGNTVTPFPVGSVKGYKDGNTGDFIVDFVRTDRKTPFTLFSAAAIPDSDGSAGGTEQYIAKFYRDTLGAVGALIRTLTSTEDTSGGSGISITTRELAGDILTFPKITYTAADLSDDFASSDTSLFVEIHRVGLHIAEGRSVTERITIERLY